MTSLGAHALEGNWLLRKSTRAYKCDVIRADGDLEYAMQ